MTIDINDTPITDELRRLLSDEGAQYVDRAFKAMAAIPLVLPGEEATMETDLACARQAALEAAAELQRWEAFRHSLTPVIAALHDLEVVARQTEARRHAGVVAEVKNIMRLTAEQDQAGGQARH